VRYPCRCSRLLPHNGRVNTVIAEVIRGADRKLYPARPLPAAELAEIRGRVHALYCTDGLSVRDVQRELAGQGVRRSVGSIARDLALFRCAACLST
jgi:hypothetical protein